MVWTVADAAAAGAAEPEPVHLTLAIGQAAPVLAALVSHWSQTVGADASTLGPADAAVAACAWLTAPSGVDARLIVVVSEARDDNGFVAHRRHHLVGLDGVQGCGP